jgi:hypothetical protein
MSRVESSAPDRPTRPPVAGSLSLMKALPVALAGAATALALRRYLSVRDALTAVPAELRGPLLPVPARNTTARSLSLTRLGARVTIPPGPGVNVVSPDYRLAASLRSSLARHVLR